MKLKAIYAFMLFAFLLVVQVGAEVKTVVSKPDPGPNMELSELFGILNPGTTLRVYIPAPNGILNGLYSVRFRKNPCVTSGNVKEPTIVASSKSAFGYLACVNIYCAPGPQGPWRWLRQTTDLNHVLTIDSEKEAGYSAQVFRLDIVCYQSPEDPRVDLTKGRSCAHLTIGSRTLETRHIRIAKKASAGKTAIGDLEAKDNFLKGIASSADELAASIRDAQGATNLVYVKALVDSAKAFADSLKTEKELAVQVNALAQCADFADKHLSGLPLGYYETMVRAGKSPPAKVIEKTDKILGELGQALDALAGVGKNASGGEKLTKAN